jgi:GDP/UDP-N,N'-diacetylbacillosamine 2-epimerase (hydrolysing)
MKRKICVVTGGRADYGLLRWVMEGIRAAPELQLQVVVTGTHLSPEFGLTFRDIEQDGFAIDRRVAMLLGSDSGDAIAKSMGLGLIGFGAVLEQLTPDLLLVLGDRFEILSAVSAALVARIPVAHLHGGEVTEGAYDECIRHAVTKMSHLHFVAAEAYRRRVLQLGEDPAHVFTVGGFGIDNIRNLKLLDRDAFQDSLGFRLAGKNLLVTVHPETLEESSSVPTMRELLSALDDLKETNLIFTQPNADSEGRALTSMVREFVNSRPNACLHKSLGQVRYLSAIRHVDGIVGNSSSGLMEAPSLHKGTVNIGDRQRGRLRAASVIDCSAERSAIATALARLYDPEFQASLASVANPYGDGHAAERTVAILRKQPLAGLLKKKFHDSQPSTT